MPRPAAALASNVCPIGVRLGASPHQCSVPPFVHLRHARGSLLSTPPIVLAGPLPHPLITFVGDVHHPQMVFVGALPRRHAAFLGVPPRAHVTLMQTPKRHHQKGGAPLSAHWHIPTLPLFSRNLYCTLMLSAEALTRMLSLSTWNIPLPLPFPQKKSAKFNLILIQELEIVEMDSILAPKLISTPVQMPVQSPLNSRLDTQTSI
ncbi:hypothetical protein DFH06DRAFT_1138674 [Mycena polygramma]|nr:hypothetical protein DFH06DRAFT_1138674 [Mycena polygramma]